MARPEFPRGISGEDETPIPEAIVRWDLLPVEIEGMNEHQLKQLAIEQQLMIGRLREAIEILCLAKETNSPVSKEDLEIIFSPEKHAEYDELKNRDMQ